jgi:hypothetical protein
MLLIALPHLTFVYRKNHPEYPKLFTGGGAGRPCYQLNLK